MMLLEIQNERTFWDNYTAFFSPQISQIAQIKIPRQRQGVTETTPSLLYLAIMKKNTLLFALPLLFVTAYLFFSSSPESEIELLLQDAEKLGHISSKLSPVEVLERSKDMVTLLDESVQVFWTVQDKVFERTYTKKEARQLLLSSLPQITELEVQTKVKDLQMEDSETELVLEVSVLGSLVGHEGPFFDQHRVQFRLVRRGGDWLIRGVRHLANLR